MTEAIERDGSSADSGALLLPSAATQAAAIQDQVEALHVGRDDDDAAAVIRKFHQRGVDFVLQILGPLGSS